MFNIFLIFLLCSIVWAVSISILYGTSRFSWRLLTFILHPEYLEANLKSIYQTWSRYINNPCKIDIHVHYIKEKEKPIHGITQYFIICAVYIKKCNINIDRNILTHICAKKRVCLFTNLLYKTWNYKAKLSKKYYIDWKFIIFL